MEGLADGSFPRLVHGIHREAVRLWGNGVIVDIDYSLHVGTGKVAGETIILVTQHGIRLFEQTYPGATMDFVPLGAFLKLLRAARNARVLDALQ